MPERVQVPDGLVVVRDRDPSWQAWLEGLPALADELLDAWSLRLDGRGRHGVAALVLPVRTEDGTAAALKLAWPHPENEHEHIALQTWHGDGAVLLLRADPRRRALLLERLDPDTTASQLPDLDACALVAELATRLRVPAPPQLRPLTVDLATWVEAIEAHRHELPVPRRLVDQAVSLGLGLVDDAASTGTLVHGDLHGENVLAGTREPWSVIDPQPRSGDPHYEPAPMLWNRWPEVLASGDVRRAVRRRFHALVDAGGLDEDRARDWVVVREVVNVLWTLEDAQRSQRRLDAADHDWVTRSIAVAKAVQD